MSKRATEKPAQANKSVEWAVKCLLELASAETPVTINEMAARLRVERTKASRLLGTLATLGIAERLRDLSYIPGPGIHVLSALSLRGSGVLRQALPFIQKLENRWKVRVALGVVWQNKVTYLYHSGGREDIGSAIGGVGLWPITESSIGRVILAQKEDEVIAQLIGDSLSPKEFDVYMRLIRRIRERGYELKEGARLTMAIGNRATAGLALLGEACKEQATELIDEVRYVTEVIAEKTKLRE